MQYIKYRTSMMNEYVLKSVVVIIFISLIGFSVCKHF